MLYDEKHILLIDDDERILSLLNTFLNQSGFITSSAKNSQEARSLLDYFEFDILIIDIMMPGETGLELLKSLRKDKDIPVILLSAKGEASDKISGLELGADDYMTKPFGPRELILRVKAVLRRGAQTEPSSDRLEHGELALDQESHRCTLNQIEIDLTAKEFGLLAALMSRPGRVLSREKLLEEVWGSDISVTHRTVDTHLKRLREKLGSTGALIHTVRGVGYRFAD